MGKNCLCGIWIVVLEERRSPSLLKRKKYHGWGGSLWISLIMPILFFFLLYTFFSLLYTPNNRLNTLRICTTLMKHNSADDYNYTVCQSLLRFNVHSSKVQQCIIANNTLLKPKLENDATIDVEQRSFKTYSQENTLKVLS